MKNSGMRYVSSSRPDSHGTAMQSQRTASVGPRSVSKPSAGFSRLSNRLPILATRHGPRWLNQSDCHQAAYRTGSQMPGSGSHQFRNPNAMAAKRRASFHLMWRMLRPQTSTDSTETPQTPKMRHSIDISPSPVRRDQSLLQLSQLLRSHGNDWELQCSYLRQEDLKALLVQSARSLQVSSALDLWIREDLARVDALGQQIS